MHKLFVIVKGGMVQEIYSTLSSLELDAEILDLDMDGLGEAEEKARLSRYDAVQELLDQIM